MSLPSRIRLAGQLLSHAGRVGTDLVRARSGGALPLEPRRIATVQKLNQLLAHHGVGPARSATVSRVELLDVTSISSNCNNVVIEVSGEGTGLPSTLFLKLPSTSYWTRVFCNVLRIWSNECHFYERAAARVPFRVPNPYIVADEGSHFVLGLENLHADPSVRLFTNLDMIEGVDLPLAQKCLSAFAALHAEFHGLDASERASVLPPDLHPFASPSARELSPLLSRASVYACHRKHPDVFDRDVVQLYTRAIDKYDALLDYWFSGSLTLIHGDSHLGNFFVSGDEMGMLDWQAVQWAKGIRDVQYFLINSMPETLLAEHEHTLIEHYVAELARNGVELSVDDAFAQYRAHAFQTLMTSVVSIGLSTMTDMDDVLTVLLRRSVAAIQRTEFADWLADI